MPLIEPIIRPPSEADSFLLQVTIGCSAADCTFCGAYLGKLFRAKPHDEIIADLEEGGHFYPETRRVFLLDGDALAMGNKKLLPILEAIGKTFPKLSRIASYANGMNIASRSHEELQELYRHRLSLIYIGLESGSQMVLDSVRKRSSVREMVQAVQKAQNAGIKCSVIVLLGLGGKSSSAEHIQGTIDALNQMQPRYLSFLTLMLIPGTALYGEAKCGIFQPLSPQEMLEEMRAMIEGLVLEKTIFRCDHASNYLPLEGRFPQDKKRLLEILDAAIKGKIKLRPEFMRGL